MIEIPTDRTQQYWLDEQLLTYEPIERWPEEIRRSANGMAQIIPSRSDVDTPLRAKDARRLMETSHYLIHPDDTWGPAPTNRELIVGMEEISEREPDLEVYPCCAFRPPSDNAPRLVIAGVSVRAVPGTDKRISTTSVRQLGVDVFGETVQSDRCQVGTENSDGSRINFLWIHDGKDARSTPLLGDFTSDREGEPDLTS